MQTISKVLTGSVERRVALRTLYFWLLIHLVFALFMSLLGQHQVFILEPAASIILVAVVSLLSLLTARGNNEDVFLANLGSSTTTLYFLCSAPAAVLELAVGIAT
jgi:hypothetical protein